MSEPIGHAKVLAWGGSIGLRISKAEAKRLGIRVGQEVDFQPLAKPPIDWSRFPTIRDGRGRLMHDDILGDATARELGLPRRRPQGN